jgi:hypothetical protein
VKASCAHLSMGTMHFHSLSFGTHASQSLTLVNGAEPEDKLTNPFVLEGIIEPLEFECVLVSNC